MGPNVKNLIAGFLLLATAVASSAIFLLDREDRGAEVATGPQTVPHELPQNAFIEDPGPENTAFYDTGKNLLAEPEPDPLEAAGDNLTEQLIASLGGQLERLNPQGPLAINGEPGLNTPDIEKVLADLGGTEQLSHIVPDWESDIIFSYRPKVIAGAKPEDIAAYRTAHNALTEKYLNVDPEKLIVEFTPDMVPIDAMLAEAQKTPVPEPLANYHASLLKLLAYQKKALDLSRTANIDPLRATLITNVQEENYLNAIAAFEEQTRQATQLGLLNGKGDESRIVAAFNAVFGIPTANAQWVTTNLVRLARRVWQFLKKLATEMLKDRLVHQLVTQTIKWIQGGGKPQFLTNWKGFITGVAEDEAGKVIEQYAPRLCSSFGPLVRVAVIPVNPARDLDAGPICTLDQVVGNIREFAQSFENGGWIAYGAAMQPSNNFFGAMIQMSDIVDTETWKKQKASKSDVESSSGFLSNKECVKWGDSEWDTCLFQLNDYCQTNNIPTDDCQALLDPFCGGMDTGNECTEYRNTTPGETLYGAVSDSIKAPLERIVNAKDAIALLNALLNAALSKLSLLGKSVVSKGILGLDSGAAYVGGNEPIVTGPGGGGGGGGGSGTFQSKINSAVSACGADTSLASPDGGCSPNFRVNATTGQAFVQCVVSNLNGQGLTAIQDPNASEGDEVAVKQDDTFSENYDVLVGTGAGGGCVNTKYNGTDTPAWF
ncbi:MAG: hypothetical protein RL681_448 [Candidatus Parcubacteria bacterium]|jgi:hypothetical protein